jgi:hypothetical protein
LGINDPCEIVNVTLRRKLLDFFSRRKIRGRNKENEKGRAEGGRETKTEAGLRLTKPLSSATVIASRKKE